MARRAGRAFLVLAVAAVPVPARAGSGVGELPRPIIGVGGDDPQYVALSCGLAAFNDPTGMVTQDATQMTGAVTGGPWAIGDGGATSVTITCTIQTNSDDPAAIETPSVRRTTRSNTTPGPVGVLADTVSYSRFSGDDVYVCTAVAWTGSDGPRSWEYDADDVADGVQCDRTVTIES